VGYGLASEGVSKPISVEDERLGKYPSSVEVADNDAAGLARRKC
jgi:hypothetical protein